MDRDLGSLPDYTGQDWTSPIRAASGEDVADDTVHVSLKLLGGRLITAYVLGSLAHGGFSPLVSDVDVALVLADPILPSDHEVLSGVVEKVRLMGSSLHTRVSIFWGTPASLSGRTAGGRFPPLDRLCLLDHGRLLMGDDVRNGLPRPTRRDLVVAGARFAVDVLADDVVAQAHRPELLVTASMRWTTKIVLFPVRFLFTAETGREGTNDAAVQHYVAQAHAPGATLVAAALDWRTNRPTPEHAITMLNDGLLPLYAHWLADHIQRLESYGEVEWGQAFRDWRSRLFT